MPFGGKYPQARTANDFMSRWAAGVVSFGGAAITAPRQTLIQNFIGSMMTSGLFWAMDDFGILANESLIASTVSIKKLLLGSVVNSAPHTIDRGFAFDGLSQGYNTNFIPNVHCGATAPGDMRISVYERTNVAANRSAMGVIGSNTGGPAIRFGYSGGAESVNVNSSSVGFVAADSLAYKVAVRQNNTTNVDFFKRGVATGGTLVSGGFAVNLPNLSLHVGCRNNAGTLDQFRATSIAMWGIGHSYTLPSLAAVEAAAESTVTTYMTAVGAQV